MKKPKIKFIYNFPPKEAEYICFLAKSIQMGYYQKAGMFVLPYLKKGNKETVHFPDLDYSTFFWKKITTCKNTDYGRAFPKQALNEIVGKLEKIQLPDQVVDKIINEFNKMSPALFNFLVDDLSLTKLEKVKKINVHLTHYGTPGSFYPTKSNNGYEINMTHRIDFPVENIARTITLALYRIESNKSGETGNIEWHRRTAAVDFVLKKMLNMQVDRLKTPEQETILDSKNYLIKLGFPPNTIIEIKNDQIMLYGGNANGLLTDQETKFIKKLLNQSSVTVDYDTLAQEIWGDEWTEKFSLYSLAKIAENIRRKLKENGVNKKILFNKKGEGYYLVS